jgi:hypothetical protein
MANLAMPIWAIKLLRTLSDLNSDRSSLTKSPYRRNSPQHTKFAGGWSTEQTLAYYLQEAESAATLIDDKESAGKVA